MHGNNVDMFNMFKVRSDHQCALKDKQGQKALKTSSALYLLLGHHIIVLQVKSVQCLYSSVCSNCNFCPTNTYILK